jgi:hypothetical protein
MTIAPFIPIAGAAASSLVTLAVQSLRDFSFHDLLTGGNEAEAAQGTNSPPSSAVSLSDMRSGALAALAEFQKRLGSRLAELGVSLAEPIKLAIDSAGNVREQAGHPQAAEIEHALACDDELANLFRSAAARLEAARAGEEHSRFAALYAENPELAVAQYAHLVDDQRDPPRFALQLSGDQADVLFE